MMTTMTREQDEQADRGVERHRVLLALVGPGQPGPVLASPGPGGGPEGPPAGGGSGKTQRRQAVVPGRIVTIASMAGLHGFAYAAPYIAAKHGAKRLITVSPLGIDRLLHRLHADPSRCVLVGAYALGKAQRLMMELRCRGYHEPIYIHGALERLCGLYREWGVDLGELRLVGEAKKDELRGAIVVCPPSALNDRWSRRLPDPITAMASGWMRVRGNRRRRGFDRGFVLSDHADWPELLRTVEEIQEYADHAAIETTLRYIRRRDDSARKELIETVRQDLGAVASRRAERAGMAPRRASPGSR